MINVLFNDFSYEILPKRLETYDKYSQILQWGRQNPTRFLETFMGIQLTDYQKYVILSSWVPSTCVWVCSRSTGKAQTLDSNVWIFDKDNDKYVPKKFEDLEVGDRIIGDDGNETEIIHLNPIIIDNVYEVYFDDGDVIQCNEEHLWKVLDNKFPVDDEIVETKFLLDNFEPERFAVPICRKFDKSNDYKYIINVKKLLSKKAMRCITVDNQTGCYLTGNNYTITHNSFMAAPLTMLRSILIPSHKTYIMAPSGSQAQETFTKMEDLAKGNIASALGVTSFFLDECVKINSKADAFTHDKNGYHVGLFNGSEINTLNSVAKNIVGIRSNFNVWDEAGKIPRDFFALTLPFIIQSADFKVGGGLNQEIYPKQLPNKALYLSSAEGIDSELFDQYKLAFNRMLLGDPNYFVCDLDCSHSLHPFLNGKPMPPLVTQQQIDEAFETNPYRAAREQIEKKYSLYLVTSIRFPLNCWKFLKITKPQHKIEKYLSVMVVKTEKISNMA